MAPHSPTNLRLLLVQIGGQSGTLDASAYLQAKFQDGNNLGLGLSGIPVVGLRSKWVKRANSAGTIVKCPTLRNWHGN